MDEPNNGWVDQWMDGWTNGWMGGPMDGCVNQRWMGKPRDGSLGCLGSEVREPEERLLQQHQGQTMKQGTEVGEGTLRQENEQCKARWPG